MGEIIHRKISIIGAGNVATQLGLALQEQGFPIVQVFSRTWASAKALGEKLHTDYTNESQHIATDADVYLFAVKDAVLAEIGRKLPSLPGLWVHTSGSVPMDVFAAETERYGVLYPLQTFSRNRKVVFSDIPLCIEARNPKDEILLEKIAATLSSQVVRLSSEKRNQLHLAAVFACNFTNHLYNLAADILEENDLPFDLLRPLIRETAAKIEYLHPRDAQTGPAVRSDLTIINRHLNLLNEHPEQQEIYRLLSESICRR